MIKVDGIGILRALEPSDLPWLYALENEEELWHLGVSKEPWSKHVLEQYISNQPGNLLRDGQLRMVLEIQGQLHGAVDLYDYDPFTRKAGIGIALDAESSGKGIAKPVAERLIQYAMGTLGLSMVYAVVPVDNEPSNRLFTSLAFEASGSLKQWLLKDGAHVDATIYQRLHS